MKILAVVLVSLLVAACASSPKADLAKAMKPDETNSAKVVTTNTSADIHGAPVSSTDAEKAIEAQSTAGELQKLQNESVYFDFDAFAVSSVYRDILMQQAEFIKNHKNEIVVLEGNADERGSAEYNLSLGDERATAVRKNLELLGVPASQIKVVSLGKEKPRLNCHEEKCWHENRRVDFVLKHS